MLTKTECAMMRALAIIAIVIHNFTHWLGPMVKENEYNFYEHNVRRIFVEMAHPSWDLIAHLFSFFGHYGVPVFVFLTAYGLVMKYERVAENGNTGALDFIWKHWKKLFLMMVVGYSAFVLVDYMTPSPRKYEFWNVVGQLGMFNNLYSNPDHDIWPGPYWYFGLTLQLYIVYRLIFFPGKQSLAGVMPQVRNVGVMIAILLIFMFGQLCFEPESHELNWFRYNFFGSLPVFIFGLLWTRYDIGRFFSNTSNAVAIAIGSGALVIVFSMNYATWMVAPIFVVIFTISIVKAIPAVVSSPLVWIGGLSSAMFICHPITRKVLIPIARRGDLFAGLLLYAMATIVVAIVMRKLRQLTVNS